MNVHKTPARAAAKVGALGVAAAATFTLVPAANAANTTPSQVVPQAAMQQIDAANTPFDSIAAKRWRTFSDGHRTGKGHSGILVTRKRPKGVRIIQIKARCWHSRKPMTIKLKYRTNWGKWVVCKTATQACNGKYAIARIHNAGHKLYSGDLSNTKKMSYEYWFQYYG
ncbi:hypothetical protein [Actinomadura litoris]|uniref:hypothetical protein n=1 Tax=Actinomadura litoris TaxID=2678616 RepID=UPI001FA757C2|nr:hypothetical protein [Actinomadura litoris]